MKEVLLSKIKSLKTALGAGASKVREKLGSRTTRLANPKSSSKKSFKERFQLNKIRLSQLRELGQHPAIKKFKNFAFDKKHVDKVLNMRVERMPSLAASLKLLTKLKMPFFFLLGLLLADLTIKPTVLYFIGEESPKKNARGARTNPVSTKFFMKSEKTYEDVISQNIFCPGCPVPDMKMIAISRPKDCSKAKPLRSSATLVGTIVLSNPSYSVATLIDSSQTFALKVGERFKNYGSVFEIRRTRVCFENNDGLLFYLPLPDVEEFQVEVASSPGTGGKKVSEGITQVTENELVIDRSFVLEQTNNSNILYEAYATEYRVDGEVQGFRIHSINPGSTIEKLGFKPGDIILEVDGKPMDSVARAQELYAGLGSTSDMAITILRDGNQITKSYTVK